MTTLRIEFNCLCLFARDETNKVVHVLMPSAANHVHHTESVEGGVHAHEDAGADQHASGAGSGGTMPPHVARLIHPSFTEPNNRRRLEGWHLTLGSEDSPASTPFGPFPTAEILDITKLTAATGTSGGLKVDPDLTRFDPTSGLHPKVGFVISLRGGRMLTANSEIDWELNGQDVQMAHRATWEIDNVPDALEWRSTSGQPSPLPSLANLGSQTTFANGKRGYTLTVYHTTQDALPPNHWGIRNPAEVARHFRMYYEMLDHSPNAAEIPKSNRKDIMARTVNCGVAQALIA